MKIIPKQLIIIFLLFVITSSDQKNTINNINFNFKSKLDNLYSNRFIENNIKSIVNISNIQLNSKFTKFKARIKGLHDDAKSKLTVKADYGYSGYNGMTLANPNGLPGFIHYDQEKQVAKNTKCDFRGLLWNPFCWVKIYQRMFMAINGNPINQLMQKYFAFNGSKKYGIPCFIQKCIEPDFNFPDEVQVDLELRKGWFVDEIELLFFHTPEFLKIDYRYDENKDDEEHWMPLLDWFPTETSKAIEIPGIIFGILIMFVPFLFIIIVFIVMVILFYFWFRPKYKPNTVQDQVRKIGLHRMDTQPRPMRVIRVQMKGQSSCNIFGIWFQALHMIIPSISHFQAPLRLTNQFSPQMCMIAPFFYKSLVEIVPCELILDKYPTQQLFQFEKYKVGFQEKQSKMTMSLSYNKESGEVWVDKFQKCSNCEYQMLNDYNIALFGDAAYCLSSEFDKDSDLSVFIDKNDIFVSSQMNGLQSEVCIDERTYGQQLEKDIKHVQKIAKEEVFKKGPASWISGLGDKQVMFSFKLNRIQSIILKWVTIAFTQAPATFQVICERQVVGGSPAFEEVQFVKRNRLKFHAIPLEGRACLSIQIVMLDFDMTLSKMKRQCNGSDMLVQGINRIRLIRYGHPVVIGPCTKDYTSPTEAWAIYPQDLAHMNFETTIMEAKTNASFDKIVQLNSTGFKSISIMRKSNALLSKEGSRVRGLSNIMNMVVKSARAANEMLEPLKVILAKKGGGSKALPGEDEGSPAVSCFQVFKANPNSASGFQWIQPICNPRPFKMYCNFDDPEWAQGLIVESVKNLTTEQVKSGVNTPEKLNNVCKQFGLTQELFDSKDTDRIFKVIAMGKAAKFKMMDPNSSVPFAYDFNCNMRCKNDFKLISSKQKFNGIAKVFNKRVAYAEPKYSRFDEMYLDMQNWKAGGFSKTELKDENFQALPCSDNGNYLRFLESDCDEALSGLDATAKPNQFFQVACPKSCGSKFQGKVQGDGKQSNLSNPCLAGIHSDSLRKSSIGRVAKIITMPPEKLQVNADRNGIQSQRWEQSSSFSYRMEQINCAKMKFDLGLIQVKSEVWKTKKQLGLYFMQLKMELSGSNLGMNENSSENEFEKQLKSLEDVNLDQFNDKEGQNLVSQNNHNDEESDTLLDNVKEQKEQMNKMMHKKVKQNLSQRLANISQSIFTSEKKKPQSAENKELDMRFKKDTLTKEEFEKGAGNIKIPQLKPGYQMDEQLSNLSFLNWTRVLDKAILASSKLSLTLDASAEFIESSMHDEIDKLNKLIDAVNRVQNPASAFIGDKFPFVQSIGVAAGRQGSQIGHKINDMKKIIGVLEDFDDAVRAQFDWQPIFMQDETEKVSFPPKFVHIENKFARNGPSLWKFDKNNLAPHDGALVNKTAIKVDMGDDATIVVTENAKVQDGKFGLSFKMASQAKLGLIFRQIDLQNQYSFQINFERNEFQFDKQIAGVKTSISTGVFENLQINTWQRSEIIMLKNNFQFYIQEEVGNHQSRQGRYKRREVKFMKSHKMTHMAFDGSLKQGRVGFKCSACPGTMITSFKKENQVCNSPFEGEVQIVRKQTSRFIFNKAMDFNDVFNVKFDKKVKTTKVEVTRLLKVLGYKNLNRVRNENQLEDFHLVSAVFAPNEQGRQACNYLCRFSFSLNVVKQQKLAIQAFYFNPVSNIQFIWDRELNHFVGNLNTTKFTATFYKVDLNLVQFKLNQVNLFEIEITTSDLTLKLNRKVIYSTLIPIQISKNFKMFQVKRWIQRMQGTLAFGCDDCDLQMVDASLKPLRFKQGQVESAKSKFNDLVQRDDQADDAKNNEESKLPKVSATDPNEQEDNEDSQDVSAKPTPNWQFISGGDDELKKNALLSKFIMKVNDIDKHMQLGLNEGKLVRRNKYLSEEDMLTTIECAIKVDEDTREAFCLRNYQFMGKSCRSFQQQCESCCNFNLAVQDQKVKKQACQRKCQAIYNVPKPLTP